ncbi:hypothetical protein F511_46259 [Dorcoceras hygrometricum]|uniref:Uncharacterized protein n=1 Tax=Dorcoceras hygrometricum TaxID=472368 RepID=A0A2Z6ZTZ2_9LAMI|nr:hypothetical protein F511_46259 [Dorcoceras hygrometricum]
MPPRRGRGRTTRRTAEESRASVSGEGIQQTEVADVTRLIGELESVLLRFRPTTGRTYQLVQDASQPFYSPQGSPQANRQRFNPRGKQFKKRSNLSSSSSVSSGGNRSGSVFLLILIANVKRCRSSCFLHLLILQHCSSAVNSFLNSDC